MLLAKYRKMFFKTAAGIFAAAALIFGFSAQALADVYNCGAYGAGTYQNKVCGAATGDGADGGGLADTGQTIWMILLAVLLILLGTYVIYRTRKKMNARSSQGP